MCIVDIKQIRHEILRFFPLIFLTLYTSVLIMKFFSGFIFQKLRNEAFVSLMCWRRSSRHPHGVSNKCPRHAGNCTLGAENLKKYTKCMACHVAGWTCLGASKECRRWIGVILRSVRACDVTHGLSSLSKICFVGIAVLTIIMSISLSS